MDAAERERINRVVQRARELARRYAALQLAVDQSIETARRAIHRTQDLHEAPPTPQPPAR
jgi:hypothetical protein